VQKPIAAVSLPRRILEENACWDERYSSKHLNDVTDMDFDLVVTVCDHAKETCPLFPRPVSKIHVGFEDPDGKAFEAFGDTYHEIKEVLLPKVHAALFDREIEK